jgi:hypothetical protein
MFIPHGGTLETDLKTISAVFQAGASGAVVAGTLMGNGITSVTHLATGVYQILLDDPYNRFFDLNVSVHAPPTGSAVTAGSFSTGTLYQITTVGTTNWYTAGLPSTMQPVVGAAFVAAAAGSGTGTATAVGTSGCFGYEVVGNPTATLNATGTYSGSVMFQCLGPTSTSNPTPKLTDPANGSYVHITLLLRNSTVQGKGEVFNSFV